MTTDVQPNFPLDDFLRYYNGTYLLYNGDTVLVAGRGEIPGTVALKNVRDQTANIPLQTLLNWKHLSSPELGWVEYGGVPYYVVRSPMREVTKGVNESNTTRMVPAYMQRILRKLGTPLMRRGTANIQFWNRVYMDTPVPIAQATKDVLSGKKLFSIINRKAAVMINGDTKTAREFPAVIFVKNVLSALVAADGTLKQLGEIDVTEALE